MHRRGTFTNAWMAVCYVLAMNACTANTDDQNQASRVPIFNDTDKWDIQPRIAPLRRAGEDPPPGEEPTTPEPDAGTGGGGPTRANPK